MVYNDMNNQGPDYLERMLLRQDTDSDKRTRQDYHRTGLRIPPIEKLRCKRSSFRYAAQIICDRLPLSIRESLY